MSVVSYNEIIKQAKTVKQGVEKEYKLVISSKWSYYFAKAILRPHTPIPKFSFSKATGSTGDNLSRQIVKKDYLDMAKRFVKYVETYKKLPNYITIHGKRVRVRDYSYMFSRILVYYEVNGKAPKYVNVISKAYVKPTEYPNKVYGLWVKYIKTKPKCLDDVCDYVKEYFTYLFYNDDVRSNEEVLQDKAGNCTDLLQMLTNMAEAMDYDWEVYHVMCNVSGVGHVYGRFKKKGTNNWFVRDIACIADESRYCIWCEAGNGGTLRAKNPYWFLQNRNR